MDTDTLARIKYTQDNVFELERRGGASKLELQNIWSQLQETITGDYDWVGHAMKDEDAFKRKKGICYIPESCDRAYGYFDFLAICFGSPDKEDVAKAVFALCDWQHPETVFEEGIREGEWDENGNILKQE